MDKNSNNFDRQIPTIIRSNRFDIISSMDNYPHLLETIFSFLRPKELRTIPCVSHSWNRILNHLTPKANQRRLNSIRKLQRLKVKRGQENWPIDVKCAKLKRKLSIQRKALNSIQNLSTKNFNSKDQSSDSFHEYGEQVGDENDQNSHNKLLNQPKSTKRKRWTLAQAPFKSW